MDDERRTYRQKCGGQQDRKRQTGEQRWSNGRKNRYKWTHWLRRSDGTDRQTRHAGKLITKGYNRHYYV